MAVINHSPVNIVDFDSANESHTRDNCAICLCELDERVAELACNHFFHENCLQHWANEKAQCPVCRVQFDATALIGHPGDVASNYHPDSAADHAAAMALHAQLNGGEAPYAQQGGITTSSVSAEDIIYSDECVSMGLIAGLVAAFALLILSVIFEPSEGPFLY